MRCPYCEHVEDRVVDSRTVREGRAVRRRRECLGCARRFTTYEYIEERPLQVVKRTGEPEPYDRRKLVRSVRVACAKRPVTSEGVEALVEAIERELDRSDTSKVPSRTLGEMVMERLKGLDRIAYVRFASVYRRFQDLTEFSREIRDLDDRELRRQIRRYQGELPLATEDDPDPPRPREANSTPPDGYA